MKVIAVCIFLIFSACTAKVDRNHLIFTDSISAIERNILIVDSLLSKLPEQTDPDRIQSYYYEIIDGDSLLFINGKQIGDIHRIPVKSLAEHLNMSNTESSKFKGASLILLKNDIAHCLNDFCGWTYVYKFSNDRDQFRPLIYDYGDNRSQFIVDSCKLAISDKKGNIILYKEVKHH